MPELGINSIFVLPCLEWGQIKDIFTFEIDVPIISQLSGSTPFRRTTLKFVQPVTEVFFIYQNHLKHIIEAIIIWGWQPTGQYDGIGGFAWSTNSEQGKEIGDNEVEVVSPSVVIVGGGSAATS